MTQVNRGLSNRNIVILRKLSNITAITLPQHILDELKWQPGDLVRLTIDGSKLLVEKGQVVFEEAEQK
jgi:antitoxin component of MazEF toxin-antitoxin module